MSQAYTPSLNIIDPVTPSAASAGQGIASNLNQEADRKLRAAQIASQAELAKANISSQERMASAQLEAQAAAQDREISATASEHQKYQDFLEQQQQNEIDARERQQQAEWAKQEKLLKQQQELDLAVQQAELEQANDWVNIKTQSDEKVKALREQATSLEEEMAGLMLKQADAQRLGQLVNEDTAKAFADEAAAKKEAYETGLRGMQYGVASALGEAKRNQKTFGERVAGNVEDAYANRKGASDAIPGPAAILSDVEEALKPAAYVGSFAVEAAQSVWQQVAGFFGSDVTPVERSAYTDGAILAQRAVERAMDEPGVSALMEGRDGAIAKAKVGEAVVLLAQAAAARRGGMPPDTIAGLEAKAEQTLAQAKEYVPGSVMQGIFDALGTLESTPGVREQLEKEAGVKGKNFAGALDQTLIMARQISGTFNRLTGKAGGPAFINRSAPDMEKILGARTAAEVLLSGSPEEGVKKLVEGGMSPKRAGELIQRTLGNPKIKDTPTETALREALRILRSKQAAVLGEAEAEQRSVETARGETTVKAKRGALDRQRAIIGAR